MEKGAQAVNIDSWNLIVILQLHVMVQKYFSKYIIYHQSSN